jgi:hypothetical protein
VKRQENNKEKKRRWKTETKELEISHATQMIDVVNGYFVYSLTKSILKKGEPTT